MTPLFSVVVPVYNEEKFIPHALPLLVSAMETLEVPYEVLIVENGSTDQTAAAAKLAGGPTVEVISLDEADYGSAMHHGFGRATGDWVVNFDIDYFSASFLRKVVALEGKVDLVIASKRDPESEDRRPVLRRLATRVFNLLLRVILNSGVSDTHGMKAFRKSLIDDLNDVVVSRQDLFDTELVIRAERSGYTIVEVPVVVEEMRQARSSLVKRVPRTVRGLFRIRKRLHGSTAV